MIQIQAVPAAAAQAAVNNIRPAASQLINIKRPIGRFFYLHLVLELFVDVQRDNWSYFFLLNSRMTFLNVASYSGAALSQENLLICAWSFFITSCR